VDGIADFDGDFARLVEARCPRGTEATRPTRRREGRITPGFFQETTRRAMKPAICLNSMSPPGVESVKIFVSFCVEALGSRRRGICGKIILLGDRAGERSAVDVDVPDGEEMLTRVPGGCIFFWRDDDNTSIGGGNDGVSVGGDGTVGVAKKRNAEERDRDEKTAAAIHQWRAERDATEEERRQPK